MNVEADGIERIETEVGREAQDDTLGVTGINRGRGITRKKALQAGITDQTRRIVCGIMDVLVETKTESVTTGIKSMIALREIIETDRTSPPGMTIETIDAENTMIDDDSYLLVIS